MDHQRCGKPTVVPHVFCQEHLEAFGKRPWLAFAKVPAEYLTSEEIVDRAAARRDRRGVVVAAAIWAVAFLLGLLVTLLRFRFASPRDFLWGVLIGSLLEIAVIYLSRWSWDRVLWAKWFSR